MRAILLSLLLVSFSTGFFFPRDISSFSSNQKNVESRSEEYKTLYHDQVLDHFNWRNTDATFKQRILVNDQHWDGKGPILFYTGNEGDIVLFYKNSGFVTKTLAELYKGLVVFAEHRYYGLSMPFGNQSFTPENAVYLSSEQALADYAINIREIKKEWKAERSPVIAFGGSYGGMLAAWFRLKYPHVVDGSIAASAPVLQFYGTGVTETIFNTIVTTDFEEAVTGCSKGVRSAFAEIDKLSKSDSGLATLSKVFSTCQPLKNSNDVGTLVGWISSGITYMAMADYPYPNTFLGPLPGYPINASCQLWAKKIKNGGTNLEAVSLITNMFYNYSGQGGKCNDLSGAIPDLGTSGWEYQTCTEMVMPISANGVTDMFPKAPWDEKAWDQFCIQKYKTKPRPYWVTDYYGGSLLPNGKTNFVGSNIVFSNGNLDPWRGGGVQTSLSSSLVAILIEGGAHHLDLREPNPADPKSVTNARALEIKYISQWIKEAHARRG